MSDESQSPLPAERTPSRQSVPPGAQRLTVGGLTALLEQRDCYLGALKVLYEDEEHVCDHVREFIGRVLCVTPMTKEDRRWQAPSMEDEA